MYSLELKIKKPKLKKWGDFELRKTFEVKQNNNTEGVFGYVVQKIEKSTVVNIGQGKEEEAMGWKAWFGKRLTTSAEIEEFTAGQVKYATHTYYEVFPILNGTTCDETGNCIDDQFQNGGLLRYVLEDGEYVSDDDPPTSGQIKMIGTCVFVQTDEATAKTIHAAIEAKPPSPTLVIGEKEWSLSEETPANGLPYLVDFALPAGRRIVHEVVVSWDIKGKTQVISIPKQNAGRRTKHRRAKRRITRR
jgi:hypothetical protein